VAGHLKHWYIFTELHSVTTEIIA